VSNDPQYDAEQATMHARYHKLLAQYMEKPFATRHTDEDVEASLTLVEEAMLAHPPLCECETEDGRKVWLPRKPGILEESPLPAGKRLPLEVQSLAESGIKVIPEAEWSDVISDPNRTPPRKYVKTIFDQDGYGSCASESVTGSMEARRIQDGQEHVVHNPLFVYHTVSGGRDQGSSLPDNIAFILKYGCASEAVWPRSKGFKATPSDAAYEDALHYRMAADGVVEVKNKLELGTMVLLGYPVYFGYSGHAIWMADILSTTKGIYCNSWGNWGDEGFGSISFSSVYYQYRLFAMIAAIDKGGA